jgi:hypothetical protein
MYPHCIRTVLALLALLACSAAHAAIPAFEGYAAASDEELDKMRGGFEFNFNGMQLILAFSLEQLTYVNGELVSSMKLTPLQLTLPTVTTPGTTVTAAVPASGVNPSPATTNPDPTAQTGTIQTGTTPTTAVTTQLVNNQGIINLIQNGAGNSFTLPPALSSLNTVIQNTVNDQVIRNLTVLNATLSIRSAAAAMQLGAALNQAIAASLR